jgi:hypothetical protein
MKTIYTLLDRMEETSLRCEQKSGAWLDEKVMQAVRKRNGQDNGCEEEAKKIIYFVEKDSEIADDVKNQLEYFGYAIHVRRNIHEIRTLLSNEGNQVVIINTSMINSVPGIKNELNAIKQQYYGGSISSSFPKRMISHPAQSCPLRRGGVLSSPWTREAHRPYRHSPGAYHQGALPCPDRRR